MTAATLSAWLEIPAKDLPRFLRIAVAFSSVHASLLLVYLLATSLFLKHCGSAWLPHCFFWGFLAAAALTASLRRARAREPYAQFRAGSGVVSLFLIVMGVTGRSPSFLLHFFALMVATVVAPVCSRSSAMAVMAALAVRVRPALRVLRVLTARR